MHQKYCHRIARQITTGLFFAALQQAASADCLQPESLPESVHTARLVALGELHGTEQAPTFAADMVCAYLKTGKKVALALEIPVDEQDRLNRLMSQADKGDARLMLQGSEFWTSDNQDGRSSAAMLAAVQRMAAYRRMGMNVEVWAFDIGRDQGNEGRDAVMAANLRRLLADKAGTTVVALAGNLHTRKSTRAGGSEDGKPMLYHLRDLQPLSLKMRHGGGTTWACLGERVEDMRCGVHTIRASAATGEPAGAIELRPELAPDHDGYFFVGAISASAPAGITTR